MQVGLVPRTVMLAITHKCNLKCTYCYQVRSRRDAKSMSFDTAVRIISRELSNQSASKIYFDFIGGEIFTEWKLFRDICEWLMSEPREIPYVICASTNGTLLNEDMRRWLVLHRDKVVLTLSFDGDYRMQEVNRRTGRYNVDIDFFVETWPDQGIKMTVSPATLPCLSEGIRFLHESKQVSVRSYADRCASDADVLACNIAYGVPLSPLDYTILSRELEKLVAYYLEHDVVPASMLDLDFTAFEFDREKWGTHKYCGAGTSMVCYDTDGTAYPCHYFLPLTLTEEHYQRLGEFDFGGSTRDPRCSGCCIETICPTCYGHNMLVNHSPFERDMSRCSYMKLIVLANCVLQAKRILRDGARSDRDRYTLKVVDHLYPLLSPEVHA